MKHLLYRYPIFLLLTLSTQVAAAPAERPQAVNVEVSLTPLGKRAVFVNGRATPLFWAYELTDAKQLEDYKKAGFNAVYVDVRWVESERVERVVADARRLAQAAERQGLFVIYGVECVPTTTLTRTRIAPDEDAYVRPLQQWIKFVVEELRDTPNLIGWGTQHTPTALITHDDLGFRRWLLDTYKTPEQLNLAWGTQGAQFNSVSMLSAVQLDVQGRIGGIGEPTLDVALYRWTTFTSLMQLWADLIRQHDRQHLLVTGRLNDYKSIISVPDNYDVVVPAVYPTDAEPDLETHNVHATDMARQANLFIAVPSLMTRGVGQGGVVFTSRRALWMRQMAMHGAAGIAFQDWGDFSADAGARGDIARVIAELNRSPLLTALPTPTVAMLYEPIAEGAVVGNNTLYGFGPGISLDEPNRLFLTYRRGMRYGQVDYLSHSALLRVDLKRYAVILAPLAFYLSPQAQGLLADFVAAGGVLVADIGTGMVQAGGDLRFMPEPLQALFGVYGVQSFVDMNRNMNIIQSHPLFPSLPVGAYTTGSLPDGSAFAPPIGITRRDVETANLGLLVIGRRRARIGSTLTVHPFGAGFAVYAPFRLWAHWLPDNLLYQEFHGDLFRRRALVALVNTHALTPLVLEPTRSLLSDPDPCRVEVGTIVEGTTVFNPLERAQAVRLETVGVRNFLFSGALTTYASHAATPPLALPLRVGNTEFGARLDQPLPTLAVLSDFLPPGVLHDYRFVPVQLVPLSRSVTGHLLEYGPERVQLNVWTDISDISLDADNNVVVSGARDGNARLTLMSGEYVILPHSQHRVTISRIGSRRSERQTLTATPNGLLVIERKWKAHAVTVEPVTQVEGARGGNDWRKGEGETR